MRNRRALLIVAAATTLGVAGPLALAPQADAAGASTASAFIGPVAPLRAFIGPVAPAGRKVSFLTRRTPVARPPRTAAVTPSVARRNTPLDRLNAAVPQVPVPTTPTAASPTLSPAPSAAAAPPSASPSAAASTHAFRSGVYVGAGDPAKVQAFEGYRSRTAEVVIEFLGDQDWQNIAHPEWTVAQWDNFSKSHPLVYHVPLLPRDGSGTLAAGAAGDYDANFASLAQLLVRHGQGNVTLRLGAEMNLDSQPWTIGRSKAGADNYAAYWRRVVSTMRAVPGAAFRFCWNVNNGLGSQPAENAYPGDEYVDEVGVDSYDWGWAADGGPMASPSDRWAQIRSGSHALDFWADFARIHGKKLSVPEWGLVDTAQDTHGGGDDPFYIRAMHDWLAAQDLAYEAYFNWGTFAISGSTFPQASAAYADLWR